jgi:CheY-like chemotaxis protein
MNLVLNAAEAIGSRTGIITVRTGVEEVSQADAAGLKPGRYVRLEVIDTGCGMTEETKAKIFDPFFSTKFLGRGLGLAAVAGIIRGHHGAITVDSTPGQGSCFKVLFPASSRPAEQLAPAPQSHALGGTETVLVVDDEPMVRKMVKRALERRGYTVLEADNGLAAIELFREHSSDIALVILDLTMPKMGGEEAFPELRKIRPDVKIVVSSGYNESEAMTLFDGQRVSGFIQKPYTSYGIAATVKACLTA